MDYSVQIKVFKGEKENERKSLNNSSTEIRSNKNLTVGELKLKCKEWYDTLPKGYEIIEEKLYKGNKEKQDNNEILGFTPGLEYNLIIK